jgi:hypothetical protein
VTNKRQFAAAEILPGNHWGADCSRGVCARRFGGAGRAATRFLDGFDLHLAPEALPACCDVRYTAGRFTFRRGGGGVVVDEGLAGVVCSAPCERSRASQWQQGDYFIDLAPPLIAALRHTDMRRGMRSRALHV